MLFNSLEFVLFLPLALILYWAAWRRLAVQNLLIVGLSYIFYGMWDWRFLGLLLGSTVLDYSIGRALGTTTDPGHRKRLLAASVTGNLAVLGFFKYYGFFVDSFIDLAHVLGFQPSISTLRIILPVGISFYTFQTMSYTIDVYRKELEPTRDFIALAAYVSFFPQLVAGPIERGKHLLPQVLSPRTVTASDVEQGLWLVLTGFVRKSVIADNLAPLVDRVYNSSSHPGALSLLLATTAFALQIYGDFSGYSNIARGVARWFGFDLMVNFKSPYCSLSIQEFWRRWHISLSTWLRDYLYIPLGGNAKGRVRTYVNLMTTMLLGGLWHGAAYNFIAWGAWQGGGLVFHRKLFRKRRSREREHAGLSAARAGASWLLTAAFVLQGWLLFRANSLPSVIALSGSWFDWQRASIFTTSQVITIVTAAAMVGALDYFESRNYEDLVAERFPLVVRLGLAAFLSLLILTLGSFVEQPFLYFQF